MRIPFICFLVLAASHACGQVYAYCDDSVKVQYDSLNDLVRDTGMVKDVLKPDQARQVRKRDQPGFTYSNPKNPGDQILQLMDGFDGIVRISVDDSLVFEGKAVTDRSTSLANVHVDLGERHAGSTKHLRIQYGDHCMMTELDGAYPIVMVYRLTPWVVNLMDYWPSAW
jgi:hypothetical protein